MEKERPREEVSMDFRIGGQESPASIELWQGTWTFRIGRHSLVYDRDCGGWMRAVRYTE